MDVLLQRVLKRLRLSSLIRLAGAVAAAASGLVTAVLAYTGGGDRLIKLTAAIFGFLGGLVTLLADQVVRSSSGTLIASPENHGKILSMRVAVERMDRRLARTVPAPATEAELIGMLDELDAMALDVIRFESG